MTFTYTYLNLITLIWVQFFFCFYLHFSKDTEFSDFLIYNYPIQIHCNRKKGVPSQWGCRTGSSSYTPSSHDSWWRSVLFSFPRLMLGQASVRSKAASFFFSLLIPRHLENANRLLATKPKELWWLAYLVSIIFLSWAIL